MNTNRNAAQTAEMGDLMPAPSIEYDVAIGFETAAVLSPDASAALQTRIERAREAAERVLRSEVLPPLPPALEAAIAEVLEARRRIAALHPRGTTMQLILLRAELFAAIDALGSYFDEETTNAH